jgi:N-acetylglucosaminyl-diphospho-decaprenol L-rhamnosyltransferase
MTKIALSLLFASSHNYQLEVLVVDNDSKDHSASILRHEYPNITVIENKKNVGFGRANNQALPYVNSRYVLLLNTDAFVEPDTIAKTIHYMDTNPDCGILGVKLIGRDGVLQPSCRYFPTPWNIFLIRTGLNRFFSHVKMVDDMSWDHSSIRDCDWVPGCYYLVRKEVIDQVGLFDPRYFLYYEEVDHCFAAKKAGWRVTFFPFSTVVHIGGESAKSDGEITSSGRQIESLQLESELLYFRKNYGLITVLINVFLISLADVLQTLKNFFKLKRSKKWREHISHLLLLWKLLFETRLGRQPTR